MPEFRQNMVSKEWVIIATERAKRPDNFVQKREGRTPVPPHKTDCPFCPGNESMTPPSLFSIEKNGIWSLRVVPNKFAALQSHLTTERKHEGRFLKADGFGIEAEITAKIFRQGFRVYEVPISYSGRDYAQGKKITWRDGAAALWHIIRFRFF